jgi:hypothetical protein
VKFNAHIRGRNVVVIFVVAARETTKQTTQWRSQPHSGVLDVIVRHTYLPALQQKAKNADIAQHRAL